jgi:hypothetical protein
MSVSQSNYLQHRPDYNDFDVRSSQRPPQSSAAHQRYPDHYTAESVTGRSTYRGEPSRQSAHYPRNEQLDRSGYSYRGPPASESPEYRDYRDGAEYGRNGYRGSGSLPRDVSRSKRQVPVDALSSQPGLTRPASSMQTVAAAGSYGQHPASGGGYPNGTMQSYQPHNGKNAVDFVDRDRQQQAPGAMTASATAVQQYDRVSVIIYSTCLRELSCYRVLFELLN